MSSATTRSVPVTARASTIERADVPVEQCPDFDTRLLSCLTEAGFTDLIHDCAPGPANTSSASRASRFAR